MKQTKQISATLAAAGGEKNRDIDIAVYAAGDVDPYRLSADLKVALHEKTGIAPDRFDIRILNTVIEKGDIFGLHYLRNVLGGRILVVRDPQAHTNFLERYGTRFRECEGLMQEVLA